MKLFFDKVKIHKPPLTGPWPSPWLITSDLKQSPLCSTYKSAQISTSTLYTVTQLSLIQYIIHQQLTFGGQGCLEGLRVTGMIASKESHQSKQHRLLGNVIKKCIKKERNFISLPLPVTSRDPVLLSLPRSFSAKQVYLPSSARVTLRISRLPSSQMNTLRRGQNEFFTQ